MTALIFSGVIAVWGIFVLGWCTMLKIYVDVPMLLVLSNVVVGIASSLTTLLVGRSIAQLNQQSDVKNEPQIQQVSTSEPIEEKPKTEGIT